MPIRPTLSSIWRENKRYIREKLEQADAFELVLNRDFNKINNPDPINYKAISIFAKYPYGKNNDNWDQNKRCVIVTQKNGYLELMMYFYLYALDPKPFNCNNIETATNMIMSFINEGHDHQFVERHKSAAKNIHGKIRYGTFIGTN